MVHELAKLLVVLLLDVYQTVGTFVTTDTHAGVVRGYSVPTLAGGQLEIYMGIPFAEPPVGNLRFSPPVERKHWRPKILNATEFGAACPQPLKSVRKYFGNGYTNINEDCLYLNIYSPKNISHPKSSIPVMVWIHGGYFQRGSGSGYDGRILSTKGEVIVVTVSYRLGALGLFHGLITQSGCALSPFAVYRPPHSQLSNTRSLAQLLGCPTLSTTAMVECLRTKSAEDIVEVEPKHPKLTLAFAPRVDGYFLHDVPENLLRRGEFHHNIRVLTGFVNDEASIFIPSIFDEYGGYDVTYYKTLLDDIGSGFLHKEKVKSFLICHYPPAINNTRENVKTYIQLASDFEFRIPHIRMSADLTSKGVPTWLYQFSYFSAHYPEPKWRGVYHSSELYFIFGAPHYHTVPCPGSRNATCPQIWETNPKWDSEDERISHILIDIWSSFAKLRSTNVTALVLPGGNVWNPFDKRKEFLDINSSLEIRSHPRQQMLALWDKFEYLNFYADPDPESICVN